MGEGAAGSEGTVNRFMTDKACIAITLSSSVGMTWTVG
jgi:hypothetical protein